MARDFALRACGRMFTQKGPGGGNGWKEATGSAAGSCWSPTACSLSIAAPACGIPRHRSRPSISTPAAILPACRVPSSSSSALSGAGVLLAAALAGTVGTSGCTRCEEDSTRTAAWHEDTEEEQNASSNPHLGPDSPEYVSPSQRHLLKPTNNNPEPTPLPPPAAGLSGQHLRHRYVVSVIGLPLRGKAHMARRVQRYLEFFHGAYVEIVDITSWMDGNEGSDDRLLESLASFFDADVSEAQSDQDNHCLSGMRNPEKRGNGRVAILVAGDTYGAMASVWSGISKRRRRYMAKILERELQAEIIFMEVLLEGSPGLLQQAYQDTLLRKKGMTRETMEMQLKEYQQDYVTIQDDGTEDDLAYLKIINFNQKVLANNMMNTFLGSRMVQFCSSVQPYKRTIYLTRHGESVYNTERKIGGDSGLSPLGDNYAKRLAEFAELVVAGPHSQFVCVSLAEGEGRKIRGRLSRLPSPHTTNGAESGSGVFSKGNWQGVGDVGKCVTVKEGMRLARLQVGADGLMEKAPLSIEGILDAIGDKSATLVFVEVEKVAVDEFAPRPCRLWTSSLKRTKESAQYIQHPRIPLKNGKEWLQMDQRVYRNLDEIYAGEFEGCTYEWIQANSEAESKLRSTDKLGYRYPRGESYFDIIARLDDPMQQLESLMEPILIISHQATLRLIYAFLCGIPRDDAPDLEIPLHTVIKLEFDGTSREVNETLYYLGPRYEIDSNRKGML